MYQQKYVVWQSSCIFYFSNNRICILNTLWFRSNYNNNEECTSRSSIKLCENLIMLIQTV